MRNCITVQYCRRRFSSACTSRRTVRRSLGDQRREKSSFLSKRQNDSFVVCVVCRLSFVVVVVVGVDRSYFFGLDFRRFLPTRYYYWNYIFSVGLVFFWLIADRRNKRPFHSVYSIVYVPTRRKFCTTTTRLRRANDELC